MAFKSFLRDEWSRPTLKLQIRVLVSGMEGRDVMLKRMTCIV